MAWLTALDEGLGGRRFPLDAPCLVGRGPYNHIVLNDNRISRQHAKISPESGGHVVYDLNSANGTYVNDVQVKRQRLALNDVVRFGPFSFKFEAGSDLGRAPSLRVRSEELTRRGFEPPTKIVNSVDASAPFTPQLSAGLTELEDAARKLRTLYAFMQSISVTLDTTELVDLILRHLLEVYPRAAMVGAYLLDPTTSELIPRLIRRDGGPVQAVNLATQFHEEVVGKGRAVLSAPMTSAAFADDKAQSGSGMHAPLIHRSTSLGALHVRGGDGTTTPFAQSDLDLLTAVAAQAAMALQNARMHQDSLKQQRLQQDLVLAEQIQKSFLPSQLPQVKGIEFITDYRPAYSVGGDFYDVFWLSRDKLAVFIGDVSGKGVSAALLMARVSSDLRAAALVEVEPARVLAGVNRAVVERNQHDIFVTAIYFTLDVRTHRVVMANAGHLPPIIRRGATAADKGKPGGLHRVEGGAGTAIGIFEDAEFEQVELSLGPGDTMVLCTDGVLEATNAQGAQFGFERLEASLSQGGSRAADLAERLHTDLRGHVGDAPQYDDLTLIICGISTVEEITSEDVQPASGPRSWRSSLTPLTDVTLRPPPPRE